MAQHIHPIPAFSDNYIWLFTDSAGAKACVVDPGDAQPVIEYLEAHNLNLTDILITHHHADHTGGVQTLARRYGLTVHGPSSSPFKAIDNRLQEGDQLSVLGFELKVIEVPGHTLDHIAYFCQSCPVDQHPLVFCGDTLFAAGCGRIFEGDPQMMYQSLHKLATLPADTRVYCTHEYTLANLKFALAAEPANRDLQSRSAAAAATRENDKPTLPSTISLELATNPFLRASSDTLAISASAQAGHSLSDPLAVFTALRQWKDNF